MIISLIVAMDEMGRIGFEGRLPWHLPADLNHFKSITMGHHLIMGRKTYESIGRPLPGRTMIVVTHNAEYRPQGCLVAHSLESALTLAEEGGEEEVFIIGGGEIFVQSVPIADRIYLTLVHTTLPADVNFPDYFHQNWEEISQESHPADRDNPFPYTFKTLVRKSHDPS
jgi:dihydrofolate reductase